jgi:hypothetical protein
MIHCSVCNHSAENFSLWGYIKERKFYICTQCKKERKKIKLKEYREKNSDKITKQRQEYRSKNRSILLEDSKRRYYEKRDEKNAKRRKDARDPNSPYFKWRLKNKERLKLVAQEYRQKKDFYERKSLYTKRRKQEDVQFRLSLALRSRVCSLIKNSAKADKTIPLLGCSISKLKNHLESTWQEGMSWKNYGRYGWHIDHIKPCCTFNLSSEEDQRICFHYTNLRALWAKDNLSRPKDGSDLFNQFNN